MSNAAPCSDCESLFTCLENTPGVSQFPDGDFVAALPDMLTCVRSCINGMVFRLARPLVFEKLSDYDGPPNPTFLADVLDTAAASNLHLEDHSTTRNVSPGRIVDVITQPITSDTVHDVFDSEALCLSTAANLSGHNQAMLFLQTMTLWCTLMWHIGVTADVRAVIVLLDQYGCALRNQSHNKRQAIRRVVLLKAVEGRKFISDYAKVVTLEVEELKA